MVINHSQTLNISKTLIACYIITNSRIEKKRKKQKIIWAKICLHGLMYSVLLYQIKKKSTLAVVKYIPFNHGCSSNSVYDYC